MQRPVPCRSVSRLLPLLLHFAKLHLSHRSQPLIFQHELHPHLTIFHAFSALHDFFAQVLRLSVLLIVDQRLNVLVENGVGFLHWAWQVVFGKSHGKVGQDPGQELGVLRIHVMLVVLQLLLGSQKLPACLSSPFDLTYHLLGQLLKLSHVCLVVSLAKKDVFERIAVEVWERFIIIGSVVGHTCCRHSEHHDREVLLDLEELWVEAEAFALLYVPQHRPDSTHRGEGITLQILSLQIHHQGCTVLDIL